VSGLKTNLAPLMTAFLVKELRAFRDDPIVMLDVGARGGINVEWRVFEDQMRVYCFEPDPEECSRLAAAAPPQLTYIPRALGRRAGSATLYLTDPALSSSLYRTRMDYFGRLLNRDNGLIVGESAIEVHSLDEVLAEYGVRSVDFIKLDAEGAELDILEGGPKCLAEAVPLGVLSEIRFHEEINGSPPFSLLDIFLRERGFRLYDLDFTRQSRRALPYPGLADYRKPSGERYFAYTTRGQMQDGDALYFRDLMVEANRDLAHSVSGLRLLKLCALLEVYSLSDCAGELIQHFRDRIDPIVPATKLLDLLASGMAGRTVTYEDYVRDYFAPPAVPATESTSMAQKPAGLGRLAKRIFGR
jgi:FkbM family methyltransferase